jgi:hypothetical protein
MLPLSTVKGATPNEQGVRSLQTLPLIDSVPVLLTSSNERLANDGHKEKTIPTWFNYDGKQMDDGSGVDGKKAEGGA